MIYASRVAILKAQATTSSVASTLPRRSFRELARNIGQEFCENPNEVLGHGVPVDLVDGLEKRLVTGLRYVGVPFRLNSGGESTGLCDRHHGSKARSRLNN